MRWLIPLLPIAACTPPEEGGGGKPQEPPPCGAPDATIFDIVIDDVIVLPYKPEGNPWDWDGQVPDWLLESVGLLNDVIGTLIDSGLYPPDPTAYTAAQILEISDEILQAVDEHAPDLLAPTVPPDIYAEITLLDSAGEWWTFGESETWNDDYHAQLSTIWSEVEFFKGDEVWLDIWDEDLIDDDYVSSLTLNRRDARELADCGPLVFVAADTEFSIQLMTFEIIAVDP